MRQIALLSLVLFSFISESSFANGCDGKESRKLDKNSNLVSPSFWMKSFPKDHVRIAVDVRYGTEQPKGIFFGPENDLSKGIGLDFKMDTTLPEDKRTTYRYQVTASVKLGEGRKFESDWIPSDKEEVCLDPRTWKAPRHVKLKIDMAKFADNGVDKAEIKIEFASCEPGSKVEMRRIYYFGAKTKSGEKEFDICSTDADPGFDFTVTTVQGKEQKTTKSKVLVDTSTGAEYFELRVNDKFEVEPTIVSTIP